MMLFDQHTGLVVAEMPDLDMPYEGLDSACHRHKRNWRGARGSSSSLDSFASWVLLRQTIHYPRSLAFQELVLRMGHNTR